MKFFERIWSTASCILNWLTLSTIEHHSPNQQPLVIGSNLENEPFTSPTPTVLHLKPGPTFKPPTGRLGKLPGSDFQCEYPDMKGYEPCSTEDNRGCWLRNTADLSEYNIFADYELPPPQGRHRYYVFNATDYPINADGIIDKCGKAFQRVHSDGTVDDPIFPGPWVQACWGDTVHIKVINGMTDNGTSVHWHGIRQLNSMPMDGVNGVTQCPIPPNRNSSFEYVFNVTQYGSSWYHSHFSVQYADGLQGPITLHGPSSANYDEALYPTIMTDWGHNCASYALFTNDMGDPSILLNGTGDVRQFNHSNTTIVRPKYQLNFDKPVNGRPKRYLLRLINTSFDTMLIFSIDSHLLRVISADFVPIVPYYTRAVNVAIGQRYNIIVEADQFNSTDTNFWIRTWINKGCGDHVKVPKAPFNVTYAQTGIVRYDASSVLDPTSHQWPIDFDCTDEPYDSLVPIMPWCIGAVENGNQEGEVMNVTGGTAEKDYRIGFFSLTKEYPVSDPAWAFQINYSDPTFLDMWSNGPFKPSAVVIPENYTAKDWMYFVIYNDGPGIQHPLHLHGHDFGILYVSPSDTMFNATSFAMSCADNLDLKCDNPPRRDVVTLPSKGFVVIAFKTDNPGGWLMHCHIAFHASSGLALQVLERLPDSNTLWPKSGSAWQTAEDLCIDWQKYWNGNIEDDSGI